MGTHLAGSQEIEGSTPFGSTSKVNASKDYMNRQIDLMRFDSSLVGTGFPSSCNSLVTFVFQLGD